MTRTMKAAVIRAPGGAEVLRIETRPIPVPASGEVLIRIKAFGLNRSELFTRQGLSPNVRFPRVLGIEASGIVEAAPGGEFEPGAVVMTAMGGMGRDFDGGYAEYTLVPAMHVQVVDTKLSWEVLGAIPEMLQTSWGSLFRALRLQPGERLLVRGGTTSIGLAAAAIAKAHGATVGVTTRNPESVAMLLENGADHVFVDDGSLSGQVSAVMAGGADKVLELIGTSTLRDSLQCAVEPGIVCMTGMVGNQWSIDNFSPMDVIPTGVCLTTYDGGPGDFMATPLQELVGQIADGRLKVRIGKVFALEDIVEAHRTMEKNKAGGKIVVLT